MYKKEWWLNKNNGLCLCDEDIAEILLRGEVFTICSTSTIIRYSDVYKYTNLLRVVAEDEYRGIFAKPVIPIRFDDKLSVNHIIDTNTIIFINPGIEGISPRGTALI